MSFRFSVLVVAAYGLIAVSAFGQTASPLRDINTTADASYSSDPRDLVALDGLAYFFASSAPGVSALWRSDGTTAGTRLVKDHLDGRHLTASGGKLFFVGDDGIHGNELWTSDGTTAGTRLVKDIGTGPADVVSPNRGLFAVDGTAYFAAGDFGVGLTLWKSDGTDASSTPLLAVDPELPASLGVLSGADGVTYLYANDGVNGSELWKTDGTPAGTALVRDIRPGAQGSYPQGVALLNGTMFFFADDGIHGYELWKSDGTMIGTTLVVDLNPGTASSRSNNSLAPLRVGNQFYFAADNGDGSGVGLWKSDGTAAGTVRMLAGVQPEDGVAAGNLVYFAVRGGTDEPDVLFKTDGTLSGTVPVREFVNIGNLPVSFGGSLYFSASDSEQGSQLWKTNGSLASTVLVKEINSAGSAYPGNFTVLRANAFVNGTLVFQADDGVHGRELWKSNGSAAGTALVKDIGVEAGNANPADFVPRDGRLYFTAIDDSGERTPWKTDGTPEGTLRAEALPPTPHAPGFFAFDDGIHGSELWITDGTDAGARLVKDVNPGPADGVSDSSEMLAIGGTLFFAADDGVHGAELWKTDGTAAGTVMVRNVHGGEGVGSAPSSFADLNGALIFQAQGSIGSNELWKSDGTEGGTTLIKNIEAAFGLGGMPNQVANGLLFFLTWHKAHGYWLWRTDGTSDGTFQLQGPSLLFERLELLDVDGTLLFTRQREVRTEFDSLHQGVLWKSDGTVDGTVVVKTFDPVPITEVTISPFTAYNSSLYFLAGHPSGRTDLWKTDLTESGTVPVDDLPAPATSVNSILGSYAGTLFLDVQEGAGDRSPHHIARTLGTGGTTVIAPQAFLEISEMIGVGAHVFFVAAAEATGSELWAAPLQPLISANGVVDAAGMEPALAPGGLASLFGVELAGAAASASGFPLPTTLAGAKVQVNGVDAPLLFVSPTQINFQVPYSTPISAGVSVIASLKGQQSPPETMVVAEYAPAIFVNPGTGEPIVQRHADGSLITAQNPARPGDTLVLYVTGVGGLDNPPATGAAATDSPLAMATTTPIVTIGGIEVTVLFAGLAPDFAGLGQINIRAPGTLPQGSPLPLTIRFGQSVSVPTELPF